MTSELKMIVPTLLALVGVAAVPSSSTTGCSPAANRQAVIVATDVERAICVALNADLQMSEIKIACGIADIADDILLQLVSKARAEKVARAGREAGKQVAKSLDATASSTVQFTSERK